MAMTADPDAPPASGLSAIAAGVTVAAAATSDSAAQPLSGVTSQSGTSVRDRIAWQDAGVRKFVALAVVATFVVANGLILWGVWLIFQAEMTALTAKVYTAHDRIITAELLMTLVGATTVQLGALTILMGKYVFLVPKP
jgi:hypothetical protein